MVRRSNAHNLSAKVNAPKTKNTSSKKEAQAKEDPYAKVYFSKRGHRAQRRTAPCEIRADEDEKDNKDIKLVQQQIAEAAEAAAAALKASVAHDDSAPACNAIPHAPDTTMQQHEDMVQPEIKIETPTFTAPIEVETPTFTAPIPQGQPGCVADHPAWDELLHELVKNDNTPDDEFDTPSDNDHTMAYQHHTTQDMMVVEGQAAETTEYHTEQHTYTPQTTYMQQGFMPTQPPQPAEERPVDHFDITEFVDFSSDYECSEDEA